jgi:hypothetical protein
MANIKFGSFIITKKKVEKTFFGNLFSFDWIEEKTAIEILYDEHKKIEDVIVYFDDNSTFELKESLKSIDKQKYIKSSLCMFNNKVLPITIEKFYGDDKRILFGSSNNIGKTNNIFMMNKNYKKDYDIDFSLYNCVYYIFDSDVFAISHIKNSNRCLFAYDESVLDKDYVLLILNKILL